MTFEPEMYTCNGPGESPTSDIDRASTHDVFGGPPSCASHTDWFAKAPLSVFHPVKRIV